MADPPSRVGYGGFNRLLDWVWNYIEERVGVSRWPLRPQPAFSFRPAYWTGALVAVAFVVQAVSGMLLLIYYNPSVSPSTTGGAPAAWSSTQYLIQQVPFGLLVLTAHLYGAYAVIFLAFIHFFRGFYAAAYKAPREASWLFGTVLLLCMLGMGFTGYLLPYTSLSVGATNVGIALATAAAPIGPIVAPLLQGDGTYQGLLSRMFAFHVVLIPAVLAFLLWLHVTLFETHGVAPPASSDPGARRTLTHEDDKKLGNWFPRIFLYGTKWTFGYIGALLLIVAAWPTELAPAFGSANQSGVSPEPDWYFLWLYKLADFQYVSPLVAMGVLGFIVLGLLFLPWIEQVPGLLFPRLRNPRTHPRDRPVMMFLATFLLSFFVLMTVWGGVMPGVVIPVSMYLAYLGGLAVVDATVILFFWARYRERYARRVARALSGTGTPTGSSRSPAEFPTRADLLSGSPGFWTPRSALAVILVAGLLVPLGYVLTLPSFTTVGDQRGLAVAFAVMAFAIAAIVHLVEQSERFRHASRAIPPGVAPGP
ncbi:MAG: cytochrome bc complex cytochrome b subunit [Thermoplasmata archaeon]|nr:cytochrome bc complex cytochrome b subunit [Thermoplasmata archaeon]